jgi:hypothetical protein
VSVYGKHPRQLLYLYGAGAWYRRALVLLVYLIGALALVGALIALRGLARAPGVGTALLAGLCVLLCCLWALACWAAWRWSMRLATRIELLPDRRVIAVRTLGGAIRQIALADLARFEYREFQRSGRGVQFRAPQLTVYVRAAAPFEIDLLGSIPDEAAFKAVFPNQYVKGRLPQR